MSRLALSAVWFFIAVTAATPQLTIALNSQVPPVAYASERFVFTFLENTFSSYSEISYLLTNEPSWLKINSSSHTLYGIPSSENVGDTVFQLTASNSDGTATTQVTLVVLASRSIVVHQDAVLKDLVTGGSASAPNKLFLHPESAFTFQFAKDVFSTNSSNSIYYATSSDRSPLPSWLHFEPGTLTYSGITPFIPSSSTQQISYGINLIASHVVGFSEAIANFEITITSHILCFNAPSFTFDISENTTVRIPSLLENISRDGSTLASDEIRNATTTAPSWLILNPQDLSLHGTAPVSSGNSVFYVIVMDIFGHQASTRITLQNLPTAQTIDLGKIDAVEKTYISYSLAPFLRNAVNYLSSSVELNSTWLVFDPKNMTIHGQAPSHARVYELGISIISSEDANPNQKAALTIIVHSLTEVASSPTSTTQVFGTDSISTATSTTTTSSQRLNSARKHCTILALAIALPMGGMACMILSLLLWRKRIKLSNHCRMKKLLQINRATREGSCRQPTHKPVRTQPAIETPPARACAFLKCSSVKNADCQSKRQLQLHPRTVMSNWKAQAAAGDGSEKSENSSLSHNRTSRPEPSSTVISAEICLKSGSFTDLRSLPGRDFRGGNPVNYSRSLTSAAHNDPQATDPDHSCQGIYPSHCVDRSWSTIFDSILVSDNDDDSVLASFPIPPSSSGGTASRVCLPKGSSIKRTRSQTSSKLLSKTGDQSPQETNMQHTAFKSVDSRDSDTSEASNTNYFEIASNHKFSSSTSQENSQHQKAKLLFSLKPEMQKWSKLQDTETRETSALTLTAKHSQHNDGMNVMKDNGPDPRWNSCIGKPSQCESGTFDHSDSLFRSTSSTVTAKKAEKSKATQSQLIRSSLQALACSDNIEITVMDHSQSSSGGSLRFL